MSTPFGFLSMSYIISWQTGRGERGSCSFMDLLVCSCNFRIPVLWRDVEFEQGGIKDFWLDKIFVGPLIDQSIWVICHISLSISCEGALSLSLGPMGNINFSPSIYCFIRVWAREGLLRSHGVHCPWEVGAAAWHLPRFCLLCPANPNAPAALLSSCYCNFALTSPASSTNVVLHHFYVWISWKVQHLL